MTKKLIHVLIILVIVITGAISYLGSITLPVRIAARVKEEIEQLTRKKVLIESVRFDILKGLVLEDLIIYDKRSIILWAKRASCGIPILQIFEKRSAALSVTIDYPAIYLERRSDNSFNIEDLFPKEPQPDAAAAFALHRIHIRKGRVIFFDKTLNPVFKERIDDIMMDIKLSPPDKAAFELSCGIPQIKPPMYLKFSGIYAIFGRQLAGRAYVKGFALHEFKDYYKDVKIAFSSGVINASADLIIKDSTIDIDLDGEIDNLYLSKEQLKARIDSGIKVMAEYNLKEKSLEYAGKLDVHSMDLAGIETIGPLEKIKANIEFNDSRLWSENILVDTYGMRWISRVNVVNFANPICDIYADSAAHLSVIQKMLKDEFGILLPTEMAGRADIELAMHIESGKPLKMDGHITLHDATISLGSGNFPLESVNGEAQFNLDGAKWSGIKLKYRDTPYVASGALADFSYPKIELEAVSRDMSFASNFSVKGNRVKFSKLEGRYFTSAFSVTGEIGLADKNVINADIKGELELQLKDLKKMVKNSAGLQKMKPAGKINAAFSLAGNANNLKRCDIRTKIKTGYLSICGLKMADILLDYAQKDGIGQVKSMRSLFYGGSLFATARIDWTAKALPYSVNFDAKDVKLEYFKMDTAFKDKDVAGDIMALADLSGTFKDITRLSGTGRVSVTNGKLWQLNLFKGVGSIIFSSDFSDIVFNQGSCDLKVANRELIIKNFVLKSELMDLYGSGVIGPDKIINAVMRPEVKEDAIGGTRERIAMAVSSNTAIKVTGTLEKPEFKTQTNLAEAVGGIAGAIFQQ